MSSCCALSRFNSKPFQNSLSTLAEQRHKSIQDAEFYRKQITRYEASKANLQLELGQLQDELDVSCEVLEYGHDDD